MARVTIEDCLLNVENRFALVQLAASRVRQLSRGSRPLVECKNKDVVTALREIAAGLVMPTQAVATKEDSSELKIQAPTVA